MILGLESKVDDVFSHFIRCQVFKDTISYKIVWAVCQHFRDIRICKSVNFKMMGYIKADKNMVFAIRFKCSKTCFLFCDAGTLTGEVVKVMVEIPRMSHHWSWSNTCALNNSLLLKKLFKKKNSEMLSHRTSNHLFLILANMTRPARIDETLSDLN